MYALVARVEGAGLTHISHMHRLDASSVSGGAVVELRSSATVLQALLSLFCERGSRGARKWLIAFCPAQVNLTPCIPFRKAATWQRFRASIRYASSLRAPLPHVRPMIWLLLPCRDGLRSMFACPLTPR